MNFFPLFIIIPVVELIVFAMVSSKIGLMASLGLALMTAIIGGAIVRHQGIMAFQNAQNSFQKGEMPVSDIFTGFCLIAAGALLITPGFVTDTIGFLLLVPPVREGIRTLFSKHMHVFTSRNNAKPGGQYYTHHTRSSRTNRDDIIEAEFEDITETSNGIDHKENE